MPGRPGRRYARETKRAGGRYKTRKPGQSSRLTPLTKISFWLLPPPPNAIAVRRPGTQADLVGTVAWQQLP